MIAIKENFGIKQIKGICDKSTTRIFGFIMYTRAHSYIVQALQDTAHWEALDEISGANWPIFSVRPLKPGYYGMPESQGNYMHMMVPTWQEPNENKKYLNFFSLNQSRDLPCFIAFIWKDDGEIEQVTWKLNNDSKDEAFHSIREVVEIISQTEELILPENKRTENVFRNVKGNIEAKILKQSIIRSIPIAKKIVELLISIKQ